MVDSSLIPAIKTAIRHNEIGTNSPYCLQFACLGDSGASFGIFQGDTNTNAEARSTLQAVLAAAGLDGGQVAALMDPLCRPCPDGTPLTAQQAATVDVALGSDRGRALVDRMDDSLMQVVLAGLDGSIAAAAARSCTLDAEAQLYVALWVNMTGVPTTLNKWLSGSAELGVAPPAGPAMAAADMETYLKATRFFTQYPQDFAHMQDSVAAGLAVVAAATMA